MIFQEILKLIYNEKKITSESTERLIELFGAEKFLNALEKVSLKSIKKIIFKPSMREQWIVEGENKEYIIYPFIYCSCMDFQINSNSKNKNYLCKHLISHGLFLNLNQNDSIYIIKKKDQDFYSTILTLIN